MLNHVESNMLDLLLDLLLLLLLLLDLLLLGPGPIAHISCCGCRAVPCTGIDSDGVADLCAGLRCNKTLKSLSLRRRCLGWSENQYTRK